MVIYIDDILIFGNNRTNKDVKKTLAGLLTVMDFDVCKYFLGIKIEKRDQGLFLSQWAYTTRVIKAAGLENAMTVEKPPPLGHQLSEASRPLTDEEITNMQRKPYREVIQALIYLSTRTRPARHCYGCVYA